MKTQINKFLILLMAVVLVGAGGCATDTSPNNGMSSSNQNAPNRNNPVQNPPGNTSAATDPCTGGIDEAKIKDAIKKDLPNLENQIKELNAAGNGTASLKYDPANQELILKGFITAGEKDLRDFFNRFDKFKKKDCVKIITFQGDGTADLPNFEFRLPPPATPPGSCSVDIEEALKKSDLKDQHTKNFDYLLDKSNVLTFIGHFIDEKKHASELFANLKDLSNGCISKIVLAGKSKKGGKPLLEQGFNWMVCQGIQIECNGVCNDPPCPGFSPTPTPNTETNK